MSLLLYVLIAASFGWMASKLMPDRSSLVANILVAAVGAFLAGRFVTPRLPVGSLDEAISIPVPLLAALLLLAILEFVPRKA